MRILETGEYEKEEKHQFPSQKNPRCFALESVATKWKLDDVIVDVRLPFRLLDRTRFFEFYGSTATLDAGNLDAGERRARLLFAN